ncbi:MAG: hypothetical protein JWN98_2323, partial [Abditibacteriota bacterium]|nr:hypothetical protein [Abditibacteriota bacterium]
MKNPGTVTRRLYGSFGTMLALLVLWGAFSAWNFNRLEEANQLKIHTYKVLL